MAESGGPFGLYVFVCRSTKVLLLMHPWRAVLSSSPLCLRNSSDANANHALIPFQEARTVGRSAPGVHWDSEHDGSLTHHAPEHRPLLFHPTPTVSPRPTADRL